MTRDITEIFEKYNTDKNSKGHNYAPYYQKHLPDTAKKILEIGVLRGESIKMWHEIFPEAHIYGLDLFTDGIPFHADWCTWFQGSQTDGKLLDNVRHHGEFDLIIDDASHNARHQWISFYGLWGATKLYCVEDLQCNADSFYRQGLEFKDTILYQLQSRQRLTETDCGYIISSSDWNGLSFDLHDDKIAFIYAD